MTRHWIMQHLEYLFFQIREVVNAKFPFIYVTSKIHPFSLGNHLGTSVIIGNLMIIKITSVEWAWLALEWPPA